MFFLLGCIISTSDKNEFSVLKVAKSTFKGGSIFHLLFCLGLSF